MFSSKRRLVFAAASLTLLALLIVMTARDVLSAVESLTLLALWTTLGMLAANYTGLRSFRTAFERRTSRLERDVTKGLRRVEGDVRRVEGDLSRLQSAVHADFDATRQLLEGVHQQTSARLARLELAVDEVVEAARIRDQLLQSTISLQPAMSSQPLPPMRGWAGFADFQSYLYRLVRATEPDLVVECGSGISTVVIASGLAEIGRGSIVSLDHDDWYASRTRSWLTARGLDTYAEVLLAPLADHDLSPGNPWYRHPWLEQDARDIDLLVVDGPPGSTAERARYPAVPLLQRRLQHDCVIVLDDVNRDDEREILEAWKELLPGHETIVLPHIKGTGVLFPADRGSEAQWID